jgi:hypothetical protein
MKKLSRKLLNEIHPYGVFDNNIRQIREWRAKIRQLKLYRSKGYCEICLDFIGVWSPYLKGHHAKPPSQCKEDEKHKESNIVICCNNCYKHEILKGNGTWIEIWKTNLKELEHY